MPWWCIKSKASGETQFVQSDARKTPGDHGYDESLFEVTRLPREPSEHDDFDGVKLVRNAERKAKADRRVARGRKSNDDLADLIDALQAQVADMAARIAVIEGKA